MIDVETAARIRRLHFAEHWKVGTIAGELALHRDTVRNALFSLGAGLQVARASTLDPYLAFMQETLEAHPRLRATRLFAMLRGRGYEGSARQVRRKVSQLRPRRREAFLRRRMFPGEEAQVDWASFGHVQVGAASRALSCFVMTLTYSRALYLEFFLDQTLESFLRGHVHAFADLGGVPRVLLYDNLRAAVLQRFGAAVQFNPRLIELASHYHFAPRACRPARGNEKGAVERSIRYIRDSFFAARSHCGVEDLNRQALAWRDEVALQRRWPDDDRRTVDDAFDEERQRLLSVPTHPFEADLVLAISSAKTIYLRFDLNDYSIPPGMVGRPLTLIASETTIRVLNGVTEVARHRRSYDRHQRIDDPSHIDALLADKKRARGSSQSARLSSAVPEIEAFLEAAFHQGESVALQTDRLLRLLDDYSAPELRVAVKDALDKKSPRASSVAYILAKRRREDKAPRALTVDLSRRPDLHDLYVKPHDPETYDELAHVRNEDDHDQ